ncbi:MAG: hypothetical protein OXN15_04980 [Chloroflexota bacterium]|nr:hypothetical protein [Chloroflexota bacterium]
MYLFPDPFNKRRMARRLRELGLHEAANDIHGISAEEARSIHDRQARKARRRAERRRTFLGRALNMLGF